MSLVPFSSSSAAPMPITSSVTVKLGHGNFMLWKAQMLVHLRSHSLLSHVDGTAAVPDENIVTTTGDGDDRRTVQTVNPEFATWYIRDQTVLSGILATVTEDILAHVMSANTAREAWCTLEQMFASRTRARAIQTRAQLAVAKKKGTPAADYFRHMKTLADTLAAIGQPLREDEVIAYILAGLGPDYDSLVTTLTVRSENLTLDEVYSYLLAYEHRHDLHDSDYNLGGGASANFSRRGGHGNTGGGHGNNNGNFGGGRGNGQGNRGRGNGRNGGGRGQGQGRGNGGNTNGGSSNSNNNDEPRPVCQICGKVGHGALRCYRRFDHSFTGAEHSANTASTSYNANTDPSWYLDTGATDHITSDLDRLTVRERYTGNEQVHVGNGAENSPDHTTPGVHVDQADHASHARGHADSVGASAATSPGPSAHGPEPPSPTAHDSSGSSSPASSSGSRSLDSSASSSTASPATPPPDRPHQMVTRLRDHTWKPLKRTDGTVTYTATRSDETDTEPASLVEALQHPRWKEAMSRRQGLQAASRS
ncbi:hypothetical protein QYE76_044724 [Lolium multiflorum]|uniref:Uncharacterized protein n=1 Tax=Lolium multiflorum TaxID=4521 RepID=A0AAD8TLL7_LOLMU|nr:hypothetical protein QYE76_044724 [Lolium multiflorum]